MTKGQLIQHDHLLSQAGMLRQRTVLTLPIAWRDDFDVDPWDYALVMYRAGSLVLLDCDVGI